MEDLFSLPVFFITFREALESGIIISVLLAILDRTLNGENDAELYEKMRRQVWLGTAVGVATCIIIGAVVIGGVYGIAAEVIGGAEDIWEAVFSLGASLIITAMGAVLLRVDKLQDKWRVKLASAMSADVAARQAISPVDRVKYLSEKYALFILPFITILREGFEGVIFIAGAGIGSSVSAISLSALAGLLVGSFAGFLMYKGSNVAPIQHFLLLSTCLLYLVAAGLFSKGIWHLEANQWNQIVGGDAAELGSGPGSYDIRRSVWHVNCCNPDLNGGGYWGIFNAVLGWQNSATVGSVVSYNLYWIAVAAGFVFLTLKDKGILSGKHGKPQSGLDDRSPLLADVAE